MEPLGGREDKEGLEPLKIALEAYALRHRMISGDTANAPGCAREWVESGGRAKKPSGSLARTPLSGSEPHHLVCNHSKKDIAPRLVVGESAGCGQGRIDMEEEILSTVENQLSHKLAVRLLEIKYRQLQAALAGGIR